MPGVPYPSKNNHFLSHHAQIILNSYYKLLGKKLMQDDSDSMAEAAEKLFYSPFVVLSHDISADPVFNYANLKALDLFEFEWTEFVALPSRLSAEPVHQAEREKLLKNVAQSGYSLDYQGIRISKTGRRFIISNAAIWNLYDTGGTYAGQAAFFSDWRFLN